MILTAVSLSRYLFPWPTILFLSLHLLCWKGQTFLISSCTTDFTDHPSCPFLYFSHSLTSFILLLGQQNTSVLPVMFQHQAVASHCALSLILPWLHKLSCILGSNCLFCWWCHISSSKSSCDLKHENKVLCKLVPQVRNSKSPSVCQAGQKWQDMLRMGIEYEPLKCSTFY